MRMSAFMTPVLAALVAVNVVGMPQALAEPLSPPTPGEDQYFLHLRQVFAASHDPTAARGDGELLAAGRFVCERRDHGFVGQEATFMTPAITQLAFIYLCPR